MRTRFLFMILFCAVSHLSAQEEIGYKPILEDGKVWEFDATVRFYDKDGKSVTDESILHRKFTISICGEDEATGYKKMLWTYNNEGFDEYFVIVDSYRYLSEENKVLTYYQNDFGSFDVKYLLHDFNLKKGDYYKLKVTPDYTKLYDIDEDYINVKGRIYRRLMFVDETGFVLDRWVEGIGSERRYFISQVYNSKVKTAVGDYFIVSFGFAAVYQDGELIFERDDFDAPSYSLTGIETVETDEMAKGGAALHNLSGQRVGDSYKGIVVKDGRKFKQN